MNKLLTVKELAERFGVSKWTVYQWVAKRQIPHWRLGESRHTIRFDLADLQKVYRERGRNRG